MADTRLYIQAQTFTLAVGISTTDTSITLTSFNFPDGTAIAAGDVGSVTYGTLEAGTSREEQISFTGFTTNSDGTVTLTGVTRGLGFGASDTYSEQSDLKQQHGAGSTFIISNNPAFYNEFVNKYNDETIVGTLTVPTPTSAGHAVTKAYADALVVGGLAQDKVVVAGIAGESVAAGDLVYFDDTDNEWKKTDANTASTVEGVILGIAQGVGSDGVAITEGILLSGVDANQTGLTVGVKLYASDTAGEISESAGTTVRVIGWSKSATEVYFDPYHSYLLTNGEVEALAGNGGTPSSINRFVTEQGLSGFGDGSDGALNISSGTTTLDAGGERVLVKNYTSISITGTASLTISNKHADGTILILKSQGDVTISSSGNSIDLSGMGANGGAGATTGNTAIGSGGTAGNLATTLGIIDDSNGNGGGAGDSGTAAGGGGSAGSQFAQFYSLEPYQQYNNTRFISCGHGGGGGGKGSAGTGGSNTNGGNGGAGGGAIIIECGGTYSFSGTYNVAGEDGQSSNDSTAGSGARASSGGGGGGGGCGMVHITYRNLGTNAGTLIAVGGSGGDSGFASCPSESSTGAAAGGGGSGGGSYLGAGGAGGAGGYSNASGSNGGAAGGDGAGGGGAGGSARSETGTTIGATGGEGGSTNAIMMNVIAA